MKFDFCQFFNSCQIIALCYSAKFFAILRLSFNSWWDCAITVSLLSTLKVDWIVILESWFGINAYLLRCATISLLVSMFALRTWKFFFFVVRAVLNFQWLRYESDDMRVVGPHSSDLQSGWVGWHVASSGNVMFYFHLHVSRFPRSVMMLMLYVCSLINRSLFNLSFLNLKINFFWNSSCMNLNR